MLGYPLHDANFLIYSAQHYDNPTCFDTLEFYDDLNRFKYLKRLFNKYVETGELKERLIINHLVVIYNVFGAKAATRMLFFKLRGLEPHLKPFLIFLNMLPEQVEQIGLPSTNINTVDIPIDQKIVEALRKL